MAGMTPGEGTRGTNGGVSERLIVHVIPTATARGAQREARAIVDRLDRPGVRRHHLLSLFGGSSDVTVDATLDFASPKPGVGFSPRLAVRLRSQLGRLQPSATVAHGGEALKYLVPALAGRSIPIAYYAIGTYAGRTHALQLALWRVLAQRAAIVACEGTEVLEQCGGLLRVPRDRLVFAPNGRAAEEFFPRRSDLRPGPPTALFVGAFTEGKRPDWFVSVVEELSRRGVPVRAQAVGDGPLFESLEGRARAAKVELLGRRNDVASIMREADLLVFPSRAAGEGMPGVLIEAGLSGLPAVATAAPGVATIVVDGKTGLIAPVDDLAGLVDSTERLLRDVKERDALGSAARQRCLEHYTLDQVAEVWMRIVDALMLPHPKPED